MIKGKINSKLSDYIGHWIGLLEHKKFICNFSSIYESCSRKYNSLSTLKLLLKNWNNIKKSK